MERTRLTNQRIGNAECPPGKGQTDFRKILAALEDIHYAGPIVTEALPLPDDLTAVKDTALFWKQMNINL